MANIKSAKKRVLVAERNAMRNKSIKSEVKTAIKKVDAAIAAYAPVTNGLVGVDAIIEAIATYTAEVELASCSGSNEKESLAVGGEEITLVRGGLVCGVTCRYCEGLYGRARECVFANGGYCGTDVYGLKASTVIEGACGNYVGVHCDGLKRGTAHKHVRTVLNDTALGYVEVCESRVAHKRISTDGA